MDSRPGAVEGGPTVIVVNAPVAGAVPPIAGGDARYVARSSETEPRAAARLPCGNKRVSRSPSPGWMLPVAVEDVEVQANRIASFRQTTAAA